ncbi:MAG: DUF1993 domain-containing protein [Byssovorax sp.]
MSLYEASVPQLKKMLTNADKWLEAAVEHAKAKGFDPNILASARLAPDMYPLTRQIQSIADGAKFCAARITGKEAPKHPDTETTIDELRARLQTVIAYLDTFTAKDFEGAKDRLVELPFMPGKTLSTADFLNEMSLPNFYFHAVTAYDILRHNGVPLGKMGYIGSMNMKDK